MTKGSLELFDMGGHPAYRHGDEPPRLDIYEVLPPKGFIWEYVTTYAGITESPAEFHLATGLITVGGGVAANVYYDYANQIFLNNFAVLVGPSGIGRKSSALNIGRDYFVKTMNAVCMAAEGKPVSGKTIDLLGNMFSPEALADELETANCTGFVSEYRTLLGNGAKNYQANILPLLTDIYDCPSSYKISFKGNKRGKGSCSKIIARPVINLIGATTTEYFSLSANDAAGGYLGRHLVFYSAGSGKVIPFPYPAPKDVSDSLERQLLDISGLKGIITLSQDAKDVFDANYRREHQAYLDSGNKSNAMGSFQSRKGTFWFKVAAILQVSEDRSLTVSGANMERAIRLVRWCGSCYGWLLSQIATDEWQSTRRDIHNYIRQNSGCTKSQICRAFQVKSSIRDGVLDALVEAELVTAIQEQRGERGAPAICYYPVSTVHETIHGGG